MCAVDVVTMCWPQKQLMPSCSWCNWRQYVENQVAVAPSYNLHSSTLCRIYLLASQSSLSSHIGLILSHTNPCECSVYCSMPVRRAMQVLLYHILSSVCMSFRGKKLNACLLAALHTEGKKWSQFTALHAGCLTSRTAAPAFFLLSLCQREGCYGCSAARNFFLLSLISWKCPVRHHKTRPPTPYHLSSSDTWGLLFCFLPTNAVNVLAFSTHSKIKLYRYYTNLKRLSKHEAFYLKNICQMWFKVNKQKA